MSTEPYYSISNAGVQALDRWERSTKSVQQSKQQLNQAECEVANATNELGKFMTPKDAKPGEQFNLAVNDGFLSVTPLEGNKFKVEWRTRPTARR